MKTWSSSAILLMIQVLIVDTFWINKRAERIAMTNRMLDEKDQKRKPISTLSFSYTITEQKLIDSFNNRDLISKINYANHYPKVEGGKAGLQFEITERPVASSGYYIVQGYEWNDGHYSAADRIVFEVNDTRGVVEL